MKCYAAHIKCKFLSVYDADGKRLFSFNKNDINSFPNDARVVITQGYVVDDKESPVDGMMIGFLAPEARKYVSDVMAAKAPEKTSDALGRLIKDGKATVYFKEVAADFEELSGLSWKWLLLIIGGVLLLRK